MKHSARRERICVFDCQELEVIRRGRDVNTGLVPPLVRDPVCVPLLSAGDSSGVRTK